MFWRLGYDVFIGYLLRQQVGACVLVSCTARQAASGLSQFSPRFVLSACAQSNSHWMTQLYEKWTADRSKPLAKFVLYLARCGLEKGQLHPVLPACCSGAITRCCCCRHQPRTACSLSLRVCVRRRARQRAGRLPERVQRVARLSPRGEAAGRPRVFPCSVFSFIVMWCCASGEHHSGQRRHLLLGARYRCLTCFCVAFEGDEGID